MAFENMIVAARVTGIRCPGVIPGYERNTVESEKKTIDNGIDYTMRSKCRRYVVDISDEIYVYIYCLKNY